MPELPDVTLYLERLQDHLKGQVLEAIRISNPFILRTYEPPVAEAEGRRVTGFSRLGKRVVFGLEGDYYLVFHLMIAGRFRLRERGSKIPGKVGHLALDFQHRSVMLTEAGSKKRASLHLVRGAAGLAMFDRGGLEPLRCGTKQFRERLSSENRTIKRALVDPRLMSGIGNAYSDEILHAAKLSPTRRTGQMTDAEFKRLHTAMRRVLRLWIERLRAEVGNGFPEKVTAFHDQMAVHGRFGKECPECGTRVQRIVYAANECNYCPRCQTGGKLLADRALSRLLKADWPRSLEQLEDFELRMKEQRALPDGDR